MLKKIIHFPNQIVIKILIIYERYLSSLVHRNLHYQCIYEVPCSTFAKTQFEKRLFPLALLVTSWRLLSCNPINSRIRFKNRSLN